MSDETRNEPETQVIPQTDDAVTQAMPMAETRELPETAAPTQAMPQAEPTQNGTADAPQPGQVPEPEPATMPQQVPLYSTAPPTQTAAGGVPSLLLSIPLKYMHTSVELLKLDTVRETGRLIALVIEKIAREWEGFSWF